MFGFSSVPEPTRNPLPPPPLPATVRYKPLFNYIELLSGKALSDDDKKTIITLAESGIAPAWPPKK